MPTGSNPRSKAALRPAKPGEVRNPLGINRKRPITDRYYVQCEERCPDDICKAMKVPVGSTWGTALAARAFREAVVKGNVNAMKEIREALEGRAPSMIDMPGVGRKEITMKVVFQTRRSNPDMLEQSKILEMEQALPQEQKALPQEQTRNNLGNGNSLAARDPMEDSKLLEVQNSNQNNNQDKTNKTPSKN